MSDAIEYQVNNINVVSMVRSPDARHAVRPRGFSDSNDNDEDIRR